MSTVSRLRALAAIFLLATLSPLKAAEITGARQQIVHRIQECVEGWNGGDLNRFLSLYEDASDTTVILGTDIIKGLPQIRARYAPAFPPQNAGSMPLFILDIVQLRFLDSNDALVVARYQIAAQSAAQADGVATMVFHRSAKGWRVINDQGT